MISKSSNVTCELDPVQTNLIKDFQVVSMHSLISIVSTPFYSYQLFMWHLVVSNLYFAPKLMQDFFSQQQKVILRNS